MGHREANDDERLENYLVTSLILSYENLHDGIIAIAKFSPQESVIGRVVFRVAINRDDPNPIVELEGGILREITKHIQARGLDELQSAQRYVLIFSDTVEEEFD